MEYRFHLNLPPQELLRYYEGRATQVQVRTVEGLRVQFPAQVLRRHVTENGIQGWFRINVDEGFRFQALERIC